MTTEIFKEVTFESAHQLPNQATDHKCGRLHGHSFCVVLHVKGEVDDHTGWVTDFGDIKSAFAPLHATLDHHFLNDIEGLSNPTNENLARWIWHRLQGRLPGLSKILVRETCTPACVYQGER